MSEPLNIETGLIKLSDDTVLKLRITIVDIKEVGFSPFGGINLDVKAIGGISTQSVPKKLKEAVADKPLAPPEPPRDGWEIIDIVEQKFAVAEEITETSKGKFKVRVVAEATMAARNMKYKTRANEPLYWVSWVWKISWKPAKE